MKKHYKLSNTIFSFIYNIFFLFLFKSFLAYKLLWYLFNLENINISKTKQSDLNEYLFIL